ncbi:hypothetical protein AB1Y20_012994 [Prymnesium parvum]|uniref:Plastid lipid-associated protein/fibrillin conserved domain-containing protein n=1 Tax=Prymnesium parvum TaxID=97485 RepID=A0AB34IM73_PRYPA
MPVEGAKPLFAVSPRRGRYPEFRRRRMAHLAVACLAALPLAAALRLAHPLRAPPPSARATEPDLATLKASLLAAARQFKAAQMAKWEAEARGAAVEAAEAAEGGVAQASERIRSPLQAEAFGNVELGYDGALGVWRNQTIELLEALAARNPTPAPLEGWRTSECKLDGTWRLLFTTGADATFRPTKSGGRPVTFQHIDARKGYFINSVDFPLTEGKLKGFRVVVKGIKLSNNEVSLKFKRVKLLRRSRLAKTVILPLPPNWLLRSVARWASRGKAQLSRRGAGFQILYLDDELRAHKTFDGQYFLQQRCRYKYK